MLQKIKNYIKTIQNKFLLSWVSDVTGSVGGGAAAVSTVVVPNDGDTSFSVWSTTNERRSLQFVGISFGYQI